MGLKRREFLKLGLAGISALSGCNNRPERKIISPVATDDNLIPGLPVWYASTCHECPAGCGIMVKTVDYRAIKIEGNKMHPVNMGGLCAIGQASLQGVYNPDRLKSPLLKNSEGNLKSISWDEAERIFFEKIDSSLNRSKGRIAFITSTISGSFEMLVREWMKRIGSEKLLIYEHFNYSPLKEACNITFRGGVTPEFKIDNANLILSFGADFLERWLNPVGFTKGFSKRRSLIPMPEFIYVGPRRSLTAANADEWISVEPGDELYIALGILYTIVHNNLYKREFSNIAQKLKGRIDNFSPKAVSGLTGVNEEKIISMAEAFTSAEPSIAMGPGFSTDEENSIALGIAINLINCLSGNVGRTVLFFKEKMKSDNYNILKLQREIEDDGIDLLIIKDANPVFHSSNFANSLKKVPYIVSLSSFIDETNGHAHLIMPDHHPLESWGDIRHDNGVYSLSQPAIRHIYDTRHSGDILISSAQRLNFGFNFPSFYELLRSEWMALRDRAAPESDFELFWKDSLMKGFVAEKTKELAPSINRELFEFKFPERKNLRIKPLIYPSTLLYDGRGANKPWLLETPDPVTKIVWGSWAEIHPEKAEIYNIKKGDTIIIQNGKSSIELPAVITDGVNKNCIAIPAGYGHSNFGRYAEGIGKNPFEIMSVGELKIQKGDGTEKAICLQGDFSQHDRGIVRTVYEGEKVDAEVKERDKKLSLYPSHSHKGHRWGMVIDLNRCTGCSACVVACYAENNIPAVGKKNAGDGREMSWIRIESYIEERNKRTMSLSIPILCQHCDNAPCEPVCPVFATYHNTEGLNVQVYSRCVGTRYCSQNCPYKVRRFNFFDYSADEPLNMQYNPDVSIREKGVIEKCTFCIQRIREAKERARDENRGVRDGEIQPACAQSCPADAIVFGDLNDEEGMVSRIKKESRKRSYRVFEHLNTEPSITYLMRVIKKRDGLKL